MKKIEVKEYQHFEHIVIVYELTNKEDVERYEVEEDWDKIDLFDPMLKYNSGINIGYKGGGPATFAQLIVETFREYNSSKKYIEARNKVEEYLSKIPNNGNTAIKNFVIREDEIKHLL